MSLGLEKTPIISLSSLGLFSQTRPAQINTAGSGLSSGQPGMRRQFRGKDGWN